MKRILLSTIFLFAVNCAVASISIHPYSLEFEMSSKKRMHSVRIINNSQEEKTYRVSFVNYVQREDGSYREPMPQEVLNTADAYLYFSPRQFTLKPGKMQTVNVIRRPTAELPDGEYVSHLKVAEVDIPVSREQAAEKQQKNEPGALQFQLKALYAVTIPVTLQKGNLESKFEISNAQLSVRDAVTVMEVVLQATGTKSARGDISIRDSKKKVIGQLNNVRIFPYNKERRLAIPLSKTEQELVGETLTVILKNKETGKNVSEKKISI
ncbi:molecular chaperone [Elusimicrobium minutum]|nr:hypothetical protein [Elusimicrobium minutum]